MATIAFGASVTNVNSKKRLVTIDSGKSDGLQKGDRICFYDPSGKKVGCGKIRSVKKSSSRIKLSKKRIKKIEVGMEATPGSEGGGGGSSRSKLKFAYILSPMMTTKYNKLSYFTPIDGTEETLWEPTGPQANSFLGFGAEFEMALSGGSSITAGGRMKYFREFSAQADYAPDAENPYAETSIVGSAMGFWADYYYLNFGSLRIGNGFDLDMSTVNFAAAEKTDDGGESLLAEATSKLTTMSLRTVAVYDMFLDPIGLSFGANFLLPLSASGSTVADVLDPNTSKIPSIDPNEDLVFSLGHQKAGFGLEIVIAAYIAF